MGGLHGGAMCKLGKNTDVVIIILLVGIVPRLLMPHADYQRIMSVHISPPLREGNSEGKKVSDFVNGWWKMKFSNCLNARYCYKSFHWPPQELMIGDGRNTDV